jgi:hypothetical protein
LKLLAVGCLFDLSKEISPLARRFHAFKVIDDLLEKVLLFAFGEATKKVLLKELKRNL